LAIATKRAGTGNACIGGIGVAIVALFVVDELNDVVAADRERAGITAGVGIYLILIVALLADLDCTVTACSDHALVTARVIVDSVAIVASLHTHLDDAVATGSSNTPVGAAVAVDRIPIVAAFARLDYTVATHCRRAVIATTCDCKRKPQPTHHK
jgi:hypothetical protein